MLSLLVALAAPMLVAATAESVWLVEAVRFTTPDLAREMLLKSVWQGCGIAAASAVAAGLSLGGARRGWSLVTFALIAGDLALRAPGLCPTIDADEFRPPLLAEAIHRSTHQPYIFVYDAYAEPSHLEGAGAVEFFQYGLERLTAGHAARLRIRHLLDPDLREGRGWRWRTLDRVFREQPEPRRLNLLARLGVNHLLVKGGGAQLPDLTQVISGRIMEGPLTTLYRLDRARPVISLEPSWARVSSASVAMTLAARDGPGGPLWVETAWHSPVEPSATLSATAALDELLIRGERPGRVRVRTRAQGARLLVVAQSCSEGWRATVDGRPAEPTCGDGLLLVVPVPDGEHEVELLYRPAPVTRGLGLSALAGSVWALLLALALRRRFRRPTGAQISG